MENISISVEMTIKTATALIEQLDILVGYSPSLNHQERLRSIRKEFLASRSKLYDLKDEL